MTQLADEIRGSVDPATGIGGAGRAGVPDPGGALKEDVLSPETKRLLAVIGGGLAGGTTAGKIGQMAGLGPKLIQALRTGGAGLGSGLGQAVAGERSGIKGEAVRGAIAEQFTPPAFRLAGRVGRALPGAFAKTEVGRAAIEGPIGEGVRRAGRFVKGPFRSQLEAGADAAQRKLETIGERLSAGQALDNVLIDRLENITEKSFFGGGPLIRMRQRAEIAARGFIETFAQQFRQIPDRVVRAKVIQNILKGEVQVFKATGGRLYQIADRLGGNQKIVDIRPFVLKAQALKVDFPLESIGAGARSVIRDVEKVGRKTQKAAGPPSPILNEQGVAFPGTPADPGGFVTFEQAAKIRSQLLTKTRVITDPSPGATEGAIKALSKEIDIAMNKAGRELNPEALAAKRTADRFWANGSKKFNDDFIKSVINNETPEVIFQAAIKDGIPTNIRKIKVALDNPEAFQQFQGTFFEDLLQRSIPEEGAGIITGSKLQANLRKFGPEALRELLGRNGANQIRMLARTLQLAEKGAGRGGEGAIVVQMAQAGAFITLAGAGAGLFFLPEEASSTQKGLGGVSIGGALLVLGGPVALGRFFTDERAVRFLTIGMKEAPGSKTAIRAATQLLARADELGLTEQSRKTANEALDGPRSASDQLKSDIGQSALRRVVSPPSTLDQLGQQDRQRRLQLLQQRAGQQQAGQVGPPLQ